MKLLCRILLFLFYRFRGFNTEVLKTPGPVLLVPNHLTWIDWMFLLAYLDDDWRCVTSSATAQISWLHKFIMVNKRTFPIDPTSPYAVKRMAEYLSKGGRLVLFAEGRMSRTGSLMKLYEGTGFLLHSTHAKVITCYLRGAERIRWAKHSGWKKWFTPVTAHFSDALTPPNIEGMSMSLIRARLTSWLRDTMIEQQFKTEMEFGPKTAPDAVAQIAALRPSAIVMEDVTAQRLTFRRLAIGVSLLAQQWRTRFTGGHGERIGVLLPNANATPSVILSLWAAGKTPAILNFSTGPATMLACVQLAGLKKIITSRTFLERAKLKIEPLAAAGVEFIYLEDIRTHISGASKLGALLKCWLNLKSAFTNPQWKGADTAVVLFTSGSEGMPKGVELTQANLIANVRQMLSVIDIQDSDRFFNALPLFHSFGLTVGLLMPLIRGAFVFLYPSPLHYRIVPVACYERDCTILLATNTFLNGYARKANPYDFRSIRYLFAGAEKVQEATATLVSRRFGLRILEGYGATECSPVLSVNTPQAPKWGTTGRFMPAMEWKVEPVEGIEETTDGNSAPGAHPEPSANAESKEKPSTGRLLVRGPNIMRGYLNPDANAKFQALGGWYDTGDIVHVDDEGYIHILGRQKRFAKISGEMVSLTAVEDALAGAFPHYGLRCHIAIMSKPDIDKGEMLIAVSNEPKLTLDEIRPILRAKGLPNIAAPREILSVREIPKLGTGKVNYRELQKLITP